MWNASTIVLHISRNKKLAEKRWRAACVLVNMTKCDTKKLPFKSFDALYSVWGSVLPEIAGVKPTYVPLTRTYVRPPAVKVAKALVEYARAHKIPEDMPDIRVGQVREGRFAPDVSEDIIFIERGKNAQGNFRVLIRALVAIDAQDDYEYLSANEIYEKFPTIRKMTRDEFFDCHDEAA